jgi:hypothetical protein
MLKQALDQSAGGMSGGRVNHEAGGLIQHNEELIFIDDLKFYRLGFKRDIGDGRHRDANPIPRLQLITGLCDTIIYLNVPVFNKGLNPRSR